MMKAKYLGAAIALAMAAPAANATVVKIDFATTTSGLGGPVSAALSFDTNTAQRVALVDDGTTQTATYSSSSFQWTYDLFGENRFTTPFFIDVTSSSFYYGASFYSVVPETPVVLYFFVGMSGAGVNLPVSGYENGVGILAFVNLNSTGINDLILGSAPVSYTVSYAASVPEPAVWAMMIGGVGMVGGAVRRRRTSQPLAIAA